MKAYRQPRHLLDSLKALHYDIDVIATAVNMNTFSRFTWELLRDV
ncbi:MAG: hypothetical protein QXT14_04630 [Candidatus Bathyarchaeia archaeon]